MQHDAVLWPLLNNGFCSFKAKYVPTARAPFLWFRGRCFFRG